MQTAPSLYVFGFPFHFKFLRNLDLLCLSATECGTLLSVQNVDHSDIPGSLADHHRHTLNNRNHLKYLLSVFHTAVLSSVPGATSPALSQRSVNSVRCSVRVPYLRRSISFLRGMSIAAMHRIRPEALIFLVEIHRNETSVAVFSGDYFTAMLSEIVQCASIPANTTEKQAGNIGKKRPRFLKYSVLSLGKTVFRRRSRHSGSRFFQCFPAFAGSAGESPSKSKTASVLPEAVSE